MKNLRRFLAAVVVVAMMVTAIAPVFAAEGNAYAYSQEAQKLNDLGLYKGISPTTFDPDLGTALNRETGVVMLLRLFGLEADAEAIADPDAALAKFSDAASISEWAKKQVAYAVENGLVFGYPDGTFGPKVALNGKAYCTLILRQLGYSPNYDNAPAELADKGGLTPDEATKFASKELIKDDLVGISYGMLGASDKDGNKAIQNLIDKGVVTQEAAEDAGLATPVATATPTPGPVNLDLKSAVAINSKVVEVTLNTAVKAEEASSAIVKVADSSAKEVAVKSVELAAYDADSKTVVVTLEADTTAGTLYTLTNGTKSVNFGGRGADTTKPTIVANGITSTDYNEVTVEFSEPVKLDGATFVLAEKYGTKAALAVSNMKYNGKTKIVLSTGDQKTATLYSVTATNVADFAGNVMDKDEAKTFVGQSKSTNSQIVNAAASNSAEEVVVEFKENVDPATVATTAFKVEEMYGTKAVMTVAEARMAKKDEYAIDGVTKLTDTTAKKHVILSVPGTKDATLYKVTVTGVKTLYGKDMSTTAAETYKTFVGKAKYTTEMEMGANPVTVNSNTEIKVTFPRKVDKALAETAANYAIAEAYGTKAALEVKAAELQDNGTEVKLTVGAMKNVLYKMTINNVKDIYGNAIKTSDSKNVTSYAGKAVAAKITKIVSITRNPASDETHIIVKFDQNVGLTATDVSHYTIDNSVGYPEYAETTANADEVKLTIPKTTDGKIYKITVKGLENADGIAMDSEGVSSTFVGKGNASTLPELQAVIAVDNQTLKAYFDRDVKDSSIDGATKIWNSATNVLVDAALSYVHNANVTTDLEDATEYAYQDPDNTNVLVIRVDTNDAFKGTNKDTTLAAFKMVGAPAKFATDKNTLIYAHNDEEPTDIVVDAVMAINSTTVRVYFNQPVYGTLATFADINTTKTTYGAGGAIALSNPIAVDSTKKVYDFKTGSALTNATYWLLPNTAGVTAANAIIKDKSVAGNGYVTLKDEDTSAAGLQHERQFAGTATAAGDIKEVSVIMTDARTIVVYYPEKMDTTATGTGGGASASALDFDNYTIVNGSDAAVTMSNDLAFNPATDIGKIEYKDADNSATITLNKSIKTAAGGAFLKINQLTANAVATAVVKDGTTTISKQFAASTADAAKVAIDSVSYDSATGIVTVKMNQEFKSTADLVVAAGAGTNLVAALDVTIKKAGGDYTLLAPDITDVVALNKDDGNVADSSAGFTKTLKITLAGATKATVVAGEVGKVKVKASDRMTGINGGVADTDSEMTYAQ